jgi:biotin operon repressor
VFKRLRRNGHQLKKKKKRGYTVCSSGYAATDTS